MANYEPSSCRWRKRIHRHWHVAMLATLVMLFIVAIGTFFFVRGKMIMAEQLRERLRNTAAAAAMQFDPDVIDSIRGEHDKDSPALRDTSARLNRIREQVANVKFAYIMRRKTQNDPIHLEFVADADLALSDAQLDRNGNGTVDSEEEPGYPGDEYDATEFPALQHEAFLHPAVDEEIAQDQWGYLISGYAPIQRNGQTVAVLGLDMAADEYLVLSQSIFSPVAFLLVLISALTIGGGILLFLSQRRLEAIRSVEIERSGLLRLAFHQLGNPLSILNWSLEILREDRKHKGDNDVMLHMEEGISRLQQILYALRDADLIHAGTMQYQAQIGSLNQVMRSVGTEMQLRLHKKEQSIAFELAEDVQLKMDKKLIGSVLRELLGNAIDFSDSGRLITIRTLKRQHDALIEVEDEGCGIPPQDLPRIFNEFVRGSNATKYRPDGSGLGLYIVHGIIKRAGGKIWAKSELDRGSTFSFTLPLA